MQPICITGWATIMSYSIFLDPHSKYIELCVSGEITFDDIVHLRDQAKSICQHQHIHRLLIDARLAFAHLTALDLYNLASDLASRESLPGMYYAIVIGKDSPQVDLFSQLARRRGVQLDAYSAYDEALNVLVSSGST